MDLFRSAIWWVGYRLCGTDGSIGIQEWDGRIIENPGSREPLRRRRNRLVLGSLLAVLAGTVLTLGYGLRHSFFLHVPNFKWLGFLALLSSLLMLPLLAVSALPERSKKWVVLAGIPVLLGIGLQTALAATGQPSVERARELAHSGNIEQALFVSSACVDLKVNTEEAGRFHDSIQLDRIARISEPDRVWETTRWPLLTEHGREKASEHAVQVTARAAEALQARGDWDGSERLLALVPPESTGREPIADLRWNLGAHRVSANWEVIRSRKPYDERLEACRWMNRELGALESFSDPPSSVPVSRARYDEACLQIAKDQQRDIERQRRAEEREREKRDRAEKRERERKERAAIAARRAWAYAPLLCRDGMLSPSCVCGQGSYRGCCSHHGGVDGCSKPYPSSP